MCKRIIAQNNYTTALSNEIEVRKQVVQMLEQILPPLIDHQLKNNMVGVTTSALPCWRYLFVTY